MKQKVKFSHLAIILTVIVLTLFIMGIISLRDDTDKLIPFCIIVVGVTLFGLYYCPTSVEATSDGVKLSRLMSTPKMFKYCDIEKIDTCYPSAGGLRLCGSGGYFGYWGWFSDIMIGTYFGYYGSRANCFMIKLKNGKQYVLGCDNPENIVDYIKTKIKPKSVIRK